MIGPLGSIIGKIGDWIPVPYVFGSVYNTVMAFLQTGYYHVHGASFILPDEDPITVTSNVGAWGAITQDVIQEVLAVNQIIKDYDIHWCSVSDISAALQGMLYYYTRESDAEPWVFFRAACDVVRTTAQSREIQSPSMISQIKAGTALGVGFKTDSVGAQSCKVKVYGHVYSTSLT